MKMAFLLRQLMDRGGDGDSSDEEAAALLEYEGGISTSEESEEEEGNENEDEGGGDGVRGEERQFDISLPAQHLYLGELEEEGRATMEDEETMPTLPLLCIPERVLFPGETLPMHIYNPHMIQMLRNSSTSNKPVAICTDLRTHYDVMRRPKLEELATFGTTAEILAFREEDQSEYYYGPCFVVKFLGRQRFRLLEIFRKMNGLMDGRVQILPEKMLPTRPLELFACPGHIYTSCLATQLLARSPECTLHTRIQLELCRKRLQCPLLSGSLCQVPSWTFRFYDTDYLRERLMEEQQMKTFAAEDELDSSGRLPEDIVSLSYWLSRRLPIDDTKKLELLSIHCPTQRVIRGLEILKDFTALHCVHCDTPITKKEHMFCMSVDGPLASYVNPGGYVHDTLTVMEATNLRRQGRASTEHSWFPGYQWTILNCRRCGNHKGWCFESTRKNLRPDKFYGLRRPALILKSTHLC